MFSYFRRKYKLPCRKGQLAPFFIVCVILLIIAALVTVNIGKVAKTKTYSSNATDAGALAAASEMAEVFNSIAVANCSLIHNYENFILETTKSFDTADGEMKNAIENSTEAKEKACPDPCNAIEPTISALDNVNEFINHMGSLLNQVHHYHSVQYIFYRAPGGIRPTTRRHYRNAIKTGYRYAFNNSGISPKLKDCTLANTDDCEPLEKSCWGYCENKCGSLKEEDLAQEEVFFRTEVRNEKYNKCIAECSKKELECKVEKLGSQQAHFSLWMRQRFNNPKAVLEPEYTYSWYDGQNRFHGVATRVEMDMVNEYELKHTKNNHPEEIATLKEAKSLAEQAKEELESAIKFLERACGGYKCCDSDHPRCCQIWRDNCKAAELILANAIDYQNKALEKSKQARQGLKLNEESFLSKTDIDAEKLLIAWIQEITYNSQPHNRLVDVYQTQEHEKGELGMWTTEYPLTTSSSQASFKGEGFICGPVVAEASGTVDLSAASTENYYIPDVEEPGSNPAEPGSGQEPAKAEKWDCEEVSGYEARLCEPHRSFDASLIKTDFFHQHLERDRTQRFLLPDVPEEKPVEAEPIDDETLEKIKSLY